MLIAARNAILAGGGGQPSGGYWGLCFTAEQANSTVAMSGIAHSRTPTVTLLYSTNPADPTSWAEFIVGSTTVTLANVGDKVWIKAGPGGNTNFSYGINLYNYFSLTGLVAASGNIMSLLNGEEETFELSANYAFTKFFINCTALTTAPALPATTLTTSCYTSMFSGCSLLTTAPALPATTLTTASSRANGVYANMFSGCTSLTVAPELPATSLQLYCYYQMFSGCTSLTVAPELPATTLQRECYRGMFSGCTSLATIRTAQTQAWGDGTTQDPTYSWVDGVAATGTFYCPTALGTDATITRGNSNCPAGWTVINTDA